MPMYDRACPHCQWGKEDSLERMGDTEMACPKCGKPTMRVWPKSKANGVIGDECDIWIKHGLCNEDGSPRRYRSKADIAREAVRRGLTNVVEHKGGKGTDKSKHTQRWF